ncbi:MAG: MarR family transcriptional regulator [Acidobacteria bacterium]|nr:MarR family transcriptional regulator [Acidobacteriota bacterium]
MRELAALQESASVPRESDERTRDRVLNTVLEHGPVSAAQLGKILKITPAAVRRHLDTLAAKGVIEVKLVRGSANGAGRPARRYVLSKRGQSGLGNDYLDIAITALNKLAETSSQDSVTEFARERFEQMETRFRPAVEAAGPDVAQRAKALADALTSEGFVGSSNSVLGNTPLAAEQLCQGHCPIQDLAAEFGEFCDAETEMFARLLGVDVRRLSTLASGGHVCTTHIPTGRNPAPSGAGRILLPVTQISNHPEERP